MYELGRFITDKMKLQRIKRTELVYRLGYANMNKGLRALDGCIRDGFPHPFVIQNLPKALNVEASQLEKVLETTRQELLDEEEARERKNFAPHLWVITERASPTSITMAVITGLIKKKVRLPKELPTLPFEEQLERVKGIVKYHYFIDEGQYPFFGKITGYYFVHHFRENVRLDVKGNVVKRETTPFKELEGFITIGGRIVPEGLLKCLRKGQG